MPVHDWTRVDAGIFHAFHLGWLARLQDRLNDGILPHGYYALAEQHAGRMIPDLLSLKIGDAPTPTAALLPTPDATGGLAVADAPPRVRHTHSVEASKRGRPRSLAIRHVSGHQLVALLEVVSPANKDRPTSVVDFVTKIVTALDYAIHVLLVDVFPPSRHDEHGLYNEVLQALELSPPPYQLPPDEPLTLASYAATPVIDVFAEPVALGAALPDMPLFFCPGHYVNVPLETTYTEAYHGMPAFWRAALWKAHRTHERG